MVILAGLWVYSRGSANDNIVPMPPVDIDGGIPLPITPEEGLEPPAIPEDAAPPSEPVAENPGVKEFMVTYSDEGYSPKSVSINAGDRVTFKNESSQLVWTASAMHPTHAIYPTTGGCIASTFDACKGEPKGSIWTFTFDIVGAWKYHNHLAPTQFGEIIVK